MKKTLVHRSLTRPIMVMGGERKPVMIVGLFSVLIAVAGGIHFINVVFGLFLFFTGTWVFRWMGSKDPMYFEVFLRHVKQQEYYPGNSTFKGLRRKIEEKN